MGQRTFYDRRKFLAHTTGYLALGMSASPVAALFSSVIGGMSNKAWAQAAGLNPRNYVFIQQSGAPARWMFDMFLTPYSTTNFVENPMVRTRFTSVGGLYTNPTYETVNIHGINVPWMWKFDVPRSGGGNRPLSDLLQKMLVIQGATTNNAGHGPSQQMQFLPNGATQSTLALSADATSAPFAAINNNASGFQFLSRAQKTAQPLANSNNNMLETLLSPFTQGGSVPYRQRKVLINAALNATMSELDVLAKDGHPGAGSVVQNREAAAELVADSVSSLASAWNGLLAKYRDLVSRALLTPGLDGINDQPVGGEGTRDKRYDLNEMIVTAPDMRTLVTSQTTVGRLAEGFALAEFVITNGLTTALTIGPGNISGLSLVGNSSNGMSNDQHTTGVFPTLLLSILTYRAIGACLLELIDRLTAAGKFNDTLIEIAGEFNRSARNSGTGSDHGWQGRSSAFYCGSFNGPLCLGNLVSMRNGGAQGTWGAGGNVAGLGRQLGLHDMIATQAHLLRVPSPVTSAGPIVNLSANGLVPAIERTRIV